VNNGISVVITSILAPIDDDTSLSYNQNSSVDTNLSVGNSDVYQASLQPTMLLLNTLISKQPL
jgi:hypothetical protein